MKWKRKQYNERIINIENGSFIPIVLSLNGGMSNECKVFYSRLAELISIKRNINKSMVVSWMRTKLNFSLLRSMLLCLRGSRSQKLEEVNLQDIEIAEISNK